MPCYGGAGLEYAHLAYMAVNRGFIAICKFITIFVKITN